MRMQVSNLYSKRKMVPVRTSATMEPLIPRSAREERGILSDPSGIGTVKKITHLIVYRSAMLRGSEDQFIEIEKDLRELLSLLIVAEAKERSNETLVDAMQRLLVHVEKVVDSFVCDLETQSNQGWFWRTIFFFRDMIAMRRFEDELKEIRLSLSSIRSQGASIGIRQIDTSENIQSVPQSLALWEPSNRSNVEENKIIGLEPHLKVIKSRLMGADGSKAGPRVISIVGMGGVGKTTLAKTIYNDLEIKKHFTCRAWITVSQEFVPSTLLIDISNQVQAGLQVIDQQTPSVSELANSLNRFLYSKRYLIVLDDVWLTKIWDTLCEAFPENDKGSKIIVTTRTREVALYTESADYSLLPLSMENALQLFHSVVVVPDGLDGLVEEIVGKTMGFPLALSVLTSQLSKAPTKEQLMSVRNHLKGDYTSLYSSIVEAACHLPSYLQQCLFYFGLFKEDYKIPARRLIILWVAEGLVVKEKSSDKSPEVIAEKYLYELIEKKMIQVVKWKPDGRVKTCCMMHGVLRDVWVQKAKEANFLAHHRGEASSSSGEVRISRLADHLDRWDDCYSHIHRDNSSNSSFFRSHYKTVRTLLSFDSREGTAPGKEIGDFLRRGIINRCFQGMRVLDLEGVFRPKLPESLGELIHLRYLGLRWTYLENLPSSIDKLFNLQILDLKHTYISTLPRSFWKMQQLRHLYLSESYRTRFVPPRGTGSLTDLQTLWGAFVDEESTLDNSLYRLTKLRKLGLTCRLTPDQQEATAKWILSLERLEWLRLISIDIWVKPSNLYLEPLSGLENLSRIYMLGRLTNPVVVDKFPEKLTELTLSLSGLREDPMPKLEKLPNLKILQLLSDAFVGKLMVCSPGGFPLLQVLKLWKLKQLEGWEVRKGSLPILKELEIRACTALQTIPEGLQHLEFLHELKLKDMPGEFTRRVRKGEGEDWYIIAHVHVVDISLSKDRQSQTSTDN